jgi:aminopeptidase N
VDALPESSTAGAVQRAPAATLSLQHARERAVRVSNVCYDLELRLDASAADYAGEVTVGFELADAGLDLTIDFAGGSVASVMLNGQRVDTAYNGFFLTLPGAALQQGANRVVIAFAHPYSGDGSGLYRFMDPEDGRAYLYTDFEPYQHNRLFPSFDQPDLKARYSSRVTAPADWHVVSVVAPDRVAEHAGQKTWTFPQSAPQSTYIFALHAGQYHVWEGSAGDIPLRLYVRESLARYVDHEEWFMLTRQGLAFFERYFDLPYPFGKYDQLIVPHFNFGAMENIGAVTFSERFVRRGAITREQRRHLASVLLHEMAHMWFGDLVTMQWWNGLWLNESFATFMSTLAMAQGTEFTDELESAYRSSISAYRADERETTHAIELPVPDTDSAFSNFDAITYEKGSATLKQLSHLVGPESFRRGVSNYLKRHAYANTSIDDFLGAISAAAGRDLQSWAREWLHEPGTNTVSVDLCCTDGRIASLALVQTAPAAWPALRTHRTQLGLYRFGADGATVRTVPVVYSGERTPVPEANGEPCPDFAFANHGDWDYVRAPIDASMLPALDGNLHRFDDTLLRSMLWQGVWEMVLDARLPAPRFIDFALANLPGERSDGIVPQVLATVLQALHYLRLAEATDGAVPKVEKFLWEQVGVSAPGSDRQLVMFDAYVDAAATPSATARLAALVDETEAPPAGIRLDQDRRWNALLAMAKAGHEQVATLVASELRRDPSDQGRLRSIAVSAARPDSSVKRAWLTRLLDGGVLPLADARAAAGALFPPSQHRLRASLSEQILEGLPVLNRVREQGYFNSFVAGYLVPLCDAAYLRRLDAAIAAAGELHPILRRGLKNSRFDVARCIAIAAVHGQKKSPA